MLKSSSTWPDRDLSGCLVLVDRLVAGVLISSVRISRLGEPFWGRTANKLVTSNVNVNE